MTDEERKNLNELHAFFFRPPVQGKPTRAARIDDLLTAVQTGKITVRAALWAVAAAAAVGAAWAQVRDFWK